MSDNKKSSTAKEQRLVKYNRDGTPCKLVKRSKIWDMFHLVQGDSSKAICNDCNGVISRGGGTGKSQCTTNLWKHLENKHPRLFEEASKYKEAVNRAEKVRRHPENSKAWELFSVDIGDPVTIKCLECDIEILRPSDDVTTDALWYHIMTEHPMLYDKCVNEAMGKDVSHRRGKRSSAWSEFTQHPSDPCKVVCKTCDTVVSRGTSTDSLNTTNMRRHLICNVHVAALKKKPQNFKNIIIPDIEWPGSENETKRRKVSTPEKEDSDTPAIPNCDSRSRIPLDAQALLTYRPVDLFHTGLIGYGLYEQQKRGICCDFSFVIQQRSEVSLVEGDEQAIDVIKIHSCIASLVSEKMREAVENCEMRLELVDTNKRIVQYFVEILYTGKLRLNNSIDNFDAQEIYKLARHLQANTVCAFMQRMYPYIPLPASSTTDDSSAPISAVKMNTNNNIDVGTLHLLSEACEKLPRINKRKNYIPISNSAASEAVTKSV